MDFLTSLASGAAVRARLGALLVAAHAAIFVLGCEQDCSYAPSRCPRIDLIAICKSSNACTAGGQYAPCLQGCALAPAQTLAIPLDSIDLDAKTPDLVISVAPDPSEPSQDLSDVHVAL